VIAFGIAIGAATAALFGLFAMRASGVYFVMITLALGQCVWGLAYRWNSLTGGDNGINLPRRPAFCIQLSDDVTYFYVVFGFFVLSLLLLYILVESPFGRSLVAFASAKFACGSWGTIRAFTNTWPLSLPADLADWPECYGRTPTVR